MFYKSEDNSLRKMVNGMSVDDARPIPGWLAKLVQALELADAKLVTVDDIQRVKPQLDRRTVRRAITDLVRRGWLQSTGARGTYEFIPGAAAGPFPSGDPWLILRVDLARRPNPIHVGANSAAWLLGYAQRSPRPHILVIKSGSRPSNLVKATYRVLATTPAPAHSRVDGLPVPSAAELFVEVAQLAPRLAIDSARGWLTRLLGDTAQAEIIHSLRNRRVSTVARAGFMAEVCGAEALADEIAELSPPGEGPYYTGTHRGEGRYFRRWRVYDSGGLSGS